MKFGKKKVTGLEFEKVLKECSKIARKAYRTTEKYQNEVKSILNGLGMSMERLSKELEEYEDVEHFQFKIVLDDIEKKIKERSNTGYRELEHATVAKKEYLKDFCISLFGKTKAGKSTIREALTRGDGGTIGTGSQRTTKDVREYQWKGLKLIDTPGIEAYKGEDDAHKAQEIIDLSDMVLFLTDDDSVQQGEFRAMGDLRETNKYFVVLMNVKNNIGHQVIEEYGRVVFKLKKEHAFRRFMEKSNKVFDIDRLSEHIKHVRGYVKEHLDIPRIDLVWIHALAAFLSTRPEYAKYTYGLWNLSQMDKVYRLIADEVHTHGRHRRVLTFYESTINFVDTIREMLWEFRLDLVAQAKFMREKRRELKRFFERFIIDSNQKIEDSAEEFFVPLKEWIPQFIDEFLGKNEAQSVLKQRMEKELKRVEEGMQGVIDEIITKLTEHLKEFSREYNYDFERIQIDRSDMREFKKGQIGRIARWSGVALGGVSGAALAVAYFGAANAWNPVGWIALGASVVLSIASFFLSNHEQNKWLREKQKAYDRLFNSVDKMERKTRGAYKTWFYENITTTGRREMLDEVDFFIEKLFEISNELKTYALKLDELLMEINKDLFAWLLRLELVNCRKNNIASISRDQGMITKVLISANLEIPEATIKRLEKLMREYIHIVRIGGDGKELVIQALYPARLKPEHISIKSDERGITAYVRPPKGEIGRCIGKKGVNLRLAKIVCNMRIKIVE